MFTIGCDHTFQLRQVSVLRSQIEWRYIEDRVLDRDHQQVGTAYHPRAHLVPQRELLRDLGILIDPRLDLKGPVDKLFLGATGGRLVCHSRARRTAQRATLSCCRAGSAPWEA